MRVLDNEWDHIRATLAILCDATDTADFDRLYAQIGPFWVNSGRSADGIQWGERFLHRPIVDPAARVLALSVASAGATLANTTHAAELSDQAIALGRQHATKTPLTALGFSAVQALMSGEYQRSRDQAVLTIEMSRTDATAGYDYLGGVIAAHSVLGFTRERHLLTSVRAHLEDLMPSGGLWFRVWVRGSIGFRMFLTRHPDAIAYFRETLALCVESNNVPEESMSLMYLGTRLSDDGRVAEAAEPIARVIELARTYGSAHLGAAVSRAVVILTAHHPIASAEILGGAAALPDHFVLSSRNEDLTSLSQNCENQLRTVLGDGAFEPAYRRGTRLDETALTELCITSLRELAAENRGAS